MRSRWRVSAALAVPSSCLPRMEVARQVAPQWLGQLRAKLVLRAAGRADQHGNRADQREGLHALLVLPRHLGRVEMQRGMCVRIAASGRPGPRRSWRVAVRQARHHHPVRWFKAGDLQRSPLHSFSSDSGPGKTGGNGISGFGGTWHAVTTSGAVAPASSPPGSGGRLRLLTAAGDCRDPALARSPGARQPCAEVLPTLQTHAQAGSRRVLRGSHAQTQPAERREGSRAVRHP
jgi:hypothetical protein